MMRLKKIVIEVDELNSRMMAFNLDEPCHIVVANVGIPLLLHRIRISNNSRGQSICVPSEIIIKKHTKEELQDLSKCYNGKELFDFFNISMNKIRQ